MDYPLKLNPTQKGAQKYFRQAAQGSALAADTLRKERNAGAAKMAKLRALRLAKEAEDKLAEEARAQETAIAPAPPRKRAAAAKPVKMIRMSY